MDLAMTLTAQRGTVVDNDAKVRRVNPPHHMVRVRIFLAVTGGTPIPITRKNGIPPFPDLWI